VGLVVGGAGGGEHAAGRFVRAWSGVAPPDELPLEAPAATLDGSPVPVDAADELHCIAGWLDTRAARVRLLHCGEGFAEPFPAVATFTARERRFTKAS
jgi:hypothetical protein